MTNRIAIVALAAAAAVAATPGCASKKKVQRINAQAFYQPKELPPTTKETHPLQGVQKPGPVYGQVRDEPRVANPIAPQAQGNGNGNGAAPSVTAKADAPAAATPDTGEISPAVRNVIRAPERALSEGYPAVPKTSATSGEYMTIGGVVSEVNGTPIFANRVIRSLETVLAAKAKELGPDQYRAAARSLIQQQVGEFEQAELEFAAADRTLDENDKKLAENLTVAWRTQQITRAGGSLENAKATFAAEGKDFDDEVKIQYRVTLRRIYYQRKIYPRLVVSADEMRRYYVKNLDALFSEHDEAQFRLIKIDPRAIDGGRPAALERARDVRAKAAAGEDFATLAERFNNDPRLARTKGDVGTIQRGAFRLQKVDEAVFKLQEGEVSDIIEEADGSYYVAKMGTRKNGKVRAFEEDAVQQKISADLRETQMRSMRAKIRENLLKNAVIRNDPEMMNSAIDMALQKYAAWAGRA